MHIQHSAEFICSFRGPRSLPLSDTSPSHKKRKKEKEKKIALRPNFSRTFKCLHFQLPEDGSTGCQVSQSLCHLPADPARLLKVNSMGGRRKEEELSPHLDKVKANGLPGNPGGQHFLVSCQPDSWEHTPRLWPRRAWVDPTYLQIPDHTSHMVFHLCLPPSQYREDRPG